MRMNTRGALELSVTGVVVLIIAIVVLGSVIFFIRSFFGQTQDLIGGQLEQVKAQLRDTIEQSGEPVVLDFGNDLKIKRGRPQPIYVGLRNDFTGTTGTVCYVLQFVCLRGFSSGENCDVTLVAPTGGSAPVPANTIYPTIVGGWPLQGPGDKYSEISDGDMTYYVADRSWVSKMLTFWDVPNQGTDVSPVTFQVSSANPDTYQMELRVYVDQTQSSSCSQIVPSELVNSISEPWYTKRFRIELT